MKLTLSVIMADIGSIGKPEYTRIAEKLSLDKRFVLRSDPRVVLKD
jgi:hypothetical protein